jgi:hypothetical protein
LDFFHTVSIANFKQSCEFAQKCPHAGKDEVFGKIGFFGTVGGIKILVKTRQSAIKETIGSKAQSLFAPGA